MRNNLILFISVFAIAITSFAQTNNWGTDFSGFVKVDYMLDSRQTVAAREGHFLLYPKNESLDVNGEDIYAVPSFNALAIQSRLRGTITAPDIFGAKTVGVIEGAFFGQTNDDVNGFRLRHAFVKLSWKTSSLLFGQSWHPMFITEVFPGTVSFNTGVPFQPFSRNPQIRYVKSFSNFSINLTIASQRDFASTGPSGPSSTYLRNALVPILHFGLKHKTKSFVVGGGANYVSLLPQLVTANNYKSENTITSLSFMSYAKIVAGDFTWKVEAVKGQNNYDLLMISGYAVSKIDPVTGLEEYTNLNTISLWTEFIYGTKIQYALFAGYTQNQGTDNTVVGAKYARGFNMDNVLRVSPRIVYTVGKIKLATEVEYTESAYGTNDNYLKVSDTKSISNIRLLVSVIYKI
ncbi:MAG: hypothetical protein GY936_16715 [Ignavibacteriae bacterium]|nr:hypothetical protein [Ignavibacteriota bacterium]